MAYKEIATDMVPFKVFFYVNFILEYKFRGAQHFLLKNFRHFIFKVQLCSCPCIF